MSFKLFYYQLSGKIKSAEVVEKQFKTLENAYNEYLKVEKSEELKVFLELQNYVDSKEFENRKKKTESLRFKGSEEFKLLKEFEKLKNSGKIKNYFKIKDSTELARFEKVRVSDKLKDYKNICNQITKGIIDAEKADIHPGKLKGLKKELKQSFKALRKNSDIAFFLKFEKSKEYKNYLEVNESLNLKRFYELKEKVSTKEFAQKKSFLEDLKRWEKTEDAAKKRKYKELKTNPIISNYLKVKGNSDYDFFRKWELSFSDDFKNEKLNPEKWSVVTSVAEKTLGENYALPGDIHFFTNGKNIKTGNKLTIEVRNEKTKCKKWHMPAGFIPVELNYSSGLVSTWKSFNQTDGIFEAKVKINRINEIVSTITLSGEKDSPAIHLLEMGTQNRIGISTLNNKGKITMEGLDISNLKNGEYYIFTIVKKGSKLTWKINGTEVYRAERNDFKFPLHLNAKSMVVYDVAGSKHPYRFEIEWIRCYKRKAE